jgi:hypothetical protein
MINFIISESFNIKKGNSCNLQLEATSSINANEALKNEANDGIIMNDCIGGFGLRLDARKLTKEEFKAYDGKVPILITHAFDCDHEWITGEIINRF